MEKGDRVQAEDVKKAWLDHIKPESVGMVSERFEARLWGMAISGVPGS
ncbi:MAG: hypothetical protein ACYTEU_12680 [Planctomycetota bacterium]|jgi:hypothetical protein